jgi:hypothetical protein
MRAAVFLLTRAAPFVANLGAAMTGLNAGSQAVASNPRAAATLGRLGATLRGNLDKFDDLHLEAAAAEQAGIAVAFKATGEAFDHLTEVRNAMRGMRNVISGANRLLRNGRPTDEQRAAAEALRQGALEALEKAEQAGVTP